MNASRILALVSSGCRRRALLTGSRVGPRLPRERLAEQAALSRFVQRALLDVGLLKNLDAIGVHELAACV
eukprot:1237003-Alexandrium_andersonii.AAC.1